MKALKGGHDPVRKEHAYSHTAALLQRLVGEQVADQMRWFFFYHDSLNRSAHEATRVLPVRLLFLLMDARAGLPKRRGHW